MDEKPSSAEKDYNPPQELNAFRKVTSGTGEILIPAPSEFREATDCKFLGIFLGCLVLLAACSFYTMSYSDPDRLYNGFDNCGNVCGKDNLKLDYVNCSGVNYIGKPYLSFNMTTGRRMCVETCSDIDIIVAVDVKCQLVKDHSFYGFFKGSEKYIATMVFVSFGLCLLMLVLLRYAVAYVVWFTLGATLVCLVTILGVSVSAESGRENDALIGFTIALAVILIAYTVFILVTRYKKIKLVIQLFEEATKAIFGMPLLILKPLLAFTLISLTFRLFIYMQFVFSTAGILERKTETEYDYVPDVVMTFTQMFHVFMTTWFLLFLLGCQDMVIAGAVTAWYFTRQKTYLIKPVKTSVYNLGRYHLGSVAFGSLLIVTMKVIKHIVKGLLKIAFLGRLCGVFLETIDRVLAYYSQNAYIQTAMHGEAFMDSGKRGFKLIIYNFADSVALLFVGSFVTFILKLFIICVVLIISVAFQEEEFSFFIAFVLIALFAALMTECFFALFETASNTIFMCYCEDRFMNDGIVRPHFMSPELQKFNEDIMATEKPTDIGSINKLNEETISTKA